jgi:hypothetical protein
MVFAPNSVVPQAVASGPRGNPDDARRESSLAELEMYKLQHSVCTVPQRWAEDPLLCH